MEKGTAIAFLISAGVVFMFIAPLFGPSSGCYFEKQFSKKVFSGIIKFKYLDSTNHNIQTVKLESTRKVYFTEHDVADIYDDLIVGDSVYKSVSMLKVNVKREDSIFVLEPDYMCADD